MSDHVCVSCCPARVVPVYFRALTAQSPLPLSRSAWCDPSPPVGWTDGNGNNADRCYDTGFACSGNDMGRLDHTGEYYLITFSDTPDELTFSLKDAGLERHLFPGFGHLTR